MGSIRETCAPVGHLHREVPFSERKGLANTKCLYVCPTNQRAAFLKQRGTADFRSQTDWDYAIEPRGSESELRSSRNPIGQPEAN